VSRLIHCVPLFDHWFSLLIVRPRSQLVCHDGVPKLFLLELRTLICRLYFVVIVQLCQLRTTKAAVVQQVDDLGSDRFHPVDAKG